MPDTTIATDDRTWRQRGGTNSEDAVRTVLIANRGEIAIRIARACRTLGLRSVAVYSAADCEAPHVGACDEAVPIGPAPPRESYLSESRLIEAARKTGADAIHPGYGFLSESAAFARTVAEAGLVFVGPPQEVLAAAGDKLEARRTARAAGVPVLPVAEICAKGRAEAAAAEKLGFPLLVKAAGGGGGRGMRRILEAQEVPAAVAAARREAEAAFGDPRVYLERCVSRPRHVEVQIFGDHHGHLVHLGERDCSIQRRHQKIIEETPAPGLAPALREELARAALAVGRALGYANAGTVEFLLDSQGAFYFLEVNARLQVEHPITEWVTGADLVAWQLRVAAGEPLQATQEEIRPRGHAIECRIYAEDPARDFLPAAGHLTAASEPAGPGVRIDSALRAEMNVPLEYDPLLGKISCWGPDRETARRRMTAALEETALLGVPTNLQFLRDVIRHPAFVDGGVHTDFIAENLPGWRPSGENLLVAIAAACLAESTSGARAPAGKSAEDIPSPWEALGPWRLGGRR